MPSETAGLAFVYMIRCANGRLYTGWTSNPARRLRAHQSGKGAKFTRSFHAGAFAYLEQCADKSAALKREAALKKLTKPQKEALCRGWNKAYFAEYLPDIPQMKEKE